jgi:hypothetical protein
MLAACLGRWDDAEGHFTDAREMNERFGARPSIVCTRRAWASTLLDRNAPGDRERASELIAASRGEAEALGTLYRSTIEPAVSAQLFPLRLDRLPKSDAIYSTFARAIDDAAAVIVDVTALNENVMYEVGFAHGRGRSPLLFTELSRSSRERSSSPWGRCSSA